jgi:hypothetical protein
MLSKRLTFSLGLAIIAVLAAVPASAQSCSSSTTKSRVTYSLHQPITQTIYDVCTASPATAGYDPATIGCTGLNPDPKACVTLGGEFFYEYSCQTQPNGDYHLQLISHYNLTGTKNGVKYIGTDTQTYNLKMDPDGSFPPVPTSDFTTSDKFRLIAQGPTPDEIMTQKTHIRVNAQGVITVDQQGSPVIKCTNTNTCSH